MGKYGEWGSVKNKEGRKDRWRWNGWKYGWNEREWRMEKEYKFKDLER